MAHGIEVHVFQMRGEIAIVLDEMFPVSPLPHRLFSPCSPTVIACRQAVAFRIGASEMLFDLTPSGSVVEVAFGKRPKRVQMIRQEHNRRHLERPLSLNCAKRLAQKFSGQRFAQKRPPIVCHDREEVSGVSAGRSASGD